MKKTICAVIAAVSFLWLLGLVGSMEIDTLSASEVVAQAIPATLILITSICIGGFNQ